jgi:hypothetical protein
MIVNILAGATRIDVISVHNFLKLLSRVESEDNSNKIKSYYPECECFYIEGDPVDNVTPSELTPSRRAAYL